MREETMKQDLITFEIDNLELHIEEDYDYEALYFDVKLNDDSCFPLHVDLYDVGECYYGYSLSHNMLKNIIYCMDHSNPVYQFLLKNRESICWSAMEKYNRDFADKHPIHPRHHKEGTLPLNSRGKSCQN